MRPISETFAAALRSGRQRRVTRVSVLDEGLNTLAILSGYATEGSVQIGPRRTATFTIANPDGELTPEDQYSLLYWNRQIKVERGLRLGAGYEEYVPLGVFLIDEPRIEVGPGGSTLTIRGQDRFKRADKSRFTAPTTYLAGTALRTVFADLALDAGMGAGLTNFDDAGKTLAGDRTFERQDDRLAAMLDLARDYALRLYVDALGVLVLEPAVAPTERPIVWEFRRGADATMLGISKGWSDDRLYNRVVVTGEAADTTPVEAIAEDLNPSSPARVGGPLGERPYFYTSAMITTVSQAQAVANAMLPEVALIEETIEVPAVVNPALEHLDRVRIVEEDSRTDDTYLLDAVTIPLGRGTMRLSSSAVRAFA